MTEPNEDRSKINGRGTTHTLGSTFSGASKSQESKVNEMGETAKNEQPMQVLVIEDNHDLAKLFCDLLEVMGCKTEVAFNAQSGIEQTRKLAPDLIFCDLRLPGEKNGFDFAAELRADPNFANTPLIAVTGYSDVAEHHRALNAGFNRVFPKPIKFAQILEVLNVYRGA